jgi:hypothetical protein
MEEILRRITGQECHVRVESAAGGTSPNYPEPAGEPAPTISPYRRQRAEASQEPLLKRAIELLGAQIVQMDDGFGAAPMLTPSGGGDETPEVEEA